MRTRLIRAEEPGAIEQALAVWKVGGVVAFPTDTVYGMGVLPNRVEALRRLWQIKGQNAGTFIALLFSDPDELPRFATLPDNLRPLADHFWPGPLTLMLPRTQAVPQEIGEGNLVGVRLPALALAQNLIRAAGGVLAVTSANLPGRPASCIAQAVLDQLDGKIDLVIDGGQTSIGVVSTVVDGSRWPPVVLREGAIPEADIRIVLRLIRSRGGRNAEGSK